MRHSTTQAVICSLALLSMLAVTTGAADEQTPGTPYRTQDISNARFGQQEMQRLLQQAYRLRDRINQRTIGQDRAARALQDRVIQYLENFGSRNKEPVALNLVGLPGVGKSSMLESLESMGLKVYHFDAQAFISDDAKERFADLIKTMEEASKSQRPSIILVDELDKVPELIRSGGQVTEKTNPLIGMLNQVLSGDAVRANNGAEIKPSNVMFITAMNFSPEEIEAFSKSALGEEKSFYDFTIDDFKKFDEWVRRNPNNRAIVLSRSFRSNTVSRLVPNTEIVKPLDEKDYWQIAKNNVEDTIRKATTGVNKGKRISVTYTDRYIDFLAKHTVFPASGARDTVIKANALTEQLISFGTKASPEGDRSLNRPRAINLDVDETTGQVRVAVTPKLYGGGKTTDGPSFEFPVEFDPDSRSFWRPTILSSVAPPPNAKGAAAEKPLLKKDIRAARFPKGAERAKGLAEKIDQVVIGQRENTKLLENELGAYLAKSGSYAKGPPFLGFAGFPGIGKSEMVTVAGRETGLPIARINMQNYASDSPDVLAKLVAQLQSEIALAKTKSQREGLGGKYILQIEELDKAFEIDPQTNLIKSRPAMTAIKDLLSDGHFSFSLANGPTQFGGSSSTTYNVDIRDSFPVITMNFGVDRFGFKADPRLTSIGDVKAAAKRLATRPADLKSILGSMFLPETVNRLMPKIKVVNPLSQEDYEKVIENQVGAVSQERLVDQFTGKNRSAITISLSPAYKKYLYDETVIPSEGARFTAASSRNKISSDLEAALNAIPKSGRISAEPLEITLDFDPATSSVIARAVPTKSGLESIARDLYKRPVDLSFPPLEAHGAMTEKRILTAVHEFGHAFTGVRLGQRFEYATVVPPDANTGGYVKFVGSSGSTTGKNLIAQIYTKVGSRAMERIFLSDDPLSPRSIPEITPGARGDILQATRELWNLVHEFGLDPHGGTIERSGVEGPNQYALFSSLPDEKVQQLSLVLRDMEDKLVADLLAAHPKEWYRDKITEFARMGGTTEEEFYKIIGYPYPGRNTTPTGTLTSLHDTFQGDIQEPDRKVLKSMKYKQGLTRTTARENLERATNEAIDSMKERLHSSPTSLNSVLSANIPSSARLPSSEMYAPSAKCVIETLEREITESAGSQK